MEDFPHFEPEEVTLTKPETPGTKPETKPETKPHIDPNGVPAQNGGEPARREAVISKKDAEL